MPSFEPAIDSAQPSIQTKDLSKTFGRRVGVDRLNLSILPGELYALLGDNGAGKTTTINMLTTLLKPTSGSFSICGFDGARQTEKAKACFGIVSQDLSIYQELTAFENLKFIADLYGIRNDISSRRIDELLERAGLTRRSGDRVAEFSGGMQRKLTIAGALLHSPRVLFMDEPTVGLDPAARRQIWDSLKGLKREGVTILLTTHYLEEAELLADRVGIIREGNLVAEGTVDELRRRIRGIGAIAIQLSRKVDNERLDELLLELKKQGRAARHDNLNNTLYVEHPESAAAHEGLAAVVAWLSESGLEYSRFATVEPTLEEIFLSISSERVGGAS
ncbi:MAG: ABC transporter ATP-binding protein [Candidatus Obscuribacterales bacterium]|nr:ABC transporter ATP-binding protein [Candidatus Obscuribacterales bacterium]